MTVGTSLGADRRDRSRPAHGIMFHHFHGDGHNKVQGSISAEHLAGLIEHVGPERFLPAREWVRRATANRLRPGDLCLTFDDGLKCQFDVALPVVKRFGLTALWFIYSSPFFGVAEKLEIYRYFRTVVYRDLEKFYRDFEDKMGEIFPECSESLHGFDPKTYLSEFRFYSEGDRRFRYLRDVALGPGRYASVMGAMIEASRCDLKEISAGLWMNDAALIALHADGHVVGLHSYSHPTRLEDLSAADQASEYQRNFAHLNSVLGAAPLTMSHPCNSYDRGTLTILESLGVRLGFRSNFESARFGSPLELPREDCANIRIP